MNAHNGRSAYHALQTAVTKRYQRTLAGLGDLHAVGFVERRHAAVQRSRRTCRSTRPPISAASSGFSADDQRHRAVFNGIWQVGWGFQVSALHFFAAGIRQRDVLWWRPARDRRANFSQRLRPDGTIVPRNDLFAPAQNRTDIRFQQRIPLRGGVAIDGIAEIFNAFNRPNWGIGTGRARPHSTCSTPRRRCGRCSSGSA